MQCSAPSLRMFKSSKVCTVLIDLSGTLHIEDYAIPGAVNALNRLRRKVNVKFVTNTTKESRRVLHERLHSLGFDIEKSEIFTSLSAARSYVDTHKIRPLLMLEKEAMEDFEGVGTSDPNAVVIGLAPSCFNYSKMNEAFRMLLDGSTLIGIHKARYLKKKDGLYLGPGPFVHALEYATGTQAVVLGKPEKAFFLEALQEFSCPPDQAVMIGDDVIDDVGGAQKCGMLGILVQTAFSWIPGKFCYRSLIPAVATPTYTAISTPTQL
ncbi:PREDICTED: haloacid dehalogenase-like hydrolase domain-containing protein 2 isoform X2 [Priapulus caudatus]|uniref:Haloacid dehalogenase-like hydrolase domain-containing protein 2 n=1 Tax=Priapulus caudatus TaxID=37621 RepID=A0ABM1F6G7_PRICU|nr:PREDICTED: haloacid dehalogenase-like hydrolase domain-containing protein 2 isoform X2 [Priapulus caudatus]